MYGINVHNAVIKSNESVSGITIHYVTEKYDDGEILFKNLVQFCQTKLLFPYLKKFNC